MTITNYFHISSTLFYSFVLSSCTTLSFIINPSYKHDQRSVKTRSNEMIGKFTSITKNDNFYSYGEKVNIWYNTAIQRNPIGEMKMAGSSEEKEFATVTNTIIYDGPILPSDIEENDILAGIQLQELGIDLVVAPSTVAEGTLGLFMGLSYGVEKATLPKMTLLCGYSGKTEDNGGSFQEADIGDKTVGFFIRSPQTAVFYNQQLMSIEDALKMAATQSTNNIGKEEDTKSDVNYCGLLGHEIEITVNSNDDNTSHQEHQIMIHPVDDGFPRYWVPSQMNQHMLESPADEESNDSTSDLSIQNLGQFCNDLAWDYSDPPDSMEEYKKRSSQKNIIQLIWRIEFDLEGNCLKPSYPVSVFSQDVVVEKEELMEIGTRYGWNYWQATVDLEKI